MLSLIPNKTITWVKNCSIYLSWVNSSKGVNQTVVATVLVKFDFANVDLASGVIIIVLQ